MARPESPATTRAGRSPADGIPTGLASTAMGERRRPVLGEQLGGRDNALNAVRLVLASLVIVSHAAPISGHGPTLAWHGVDLGAVAVAGFFVLSGYLIAGARSRARLGPYLRQRFLRIVPAFWTVLVVTAFVLAPASTLWTGRTWSLGDGLSHVAHNAGLWIWQWDVGSTLEGNPTGAWNGSLWTLSYEFAAYLAVGALFVVPAVRRRPVRWVAPLALLAPVLLALARGPLDVTTNVYLAVLSLGTMYVTGVLAWAVRDRVPVDGRLALAAAGLLPVVVRFGLFDYLGAPLLGYLLLYAGAVVPWRVGSVNDISYGVYIYAFPVQQLLVVVGLAGLPNAAFAAVALVLTVPFAYASWRFVERPAIRLGRVGRLAPARGPAPVSGVPATEEPAAQA